MVRRHSQRAGRDQEERKGLGVPPGGMGGLGGLPGEPGRVGRPSCSAGMGRESLPKGWQGLEGSRGMGGVRRAYRRTWRDQEAPLECREGLGGQGENGRPSERSGRGLEAIQKGRERSGGPPGVTGEVGTDGRGRESLP